MRGQRHTPSRRRISHESTQLHKFLECICIGNSMICSDIWRKYHEWYFEIITRYLRQFWNITSGTYAKYHAQIMLLFVYTTTHKRFLIFTCRYFKVSWNTTALSQSNCRNFSFSCINVGMELRGSTSKFIYLDTNLPAINLFKFLK